MDYNFKQIESKWRQRWVERLDADLSVFGDLFGREGLGVLQIPDAFLCGARNEQNAENRCPDEKAELLHVLVRR